MSSRSAGFTLLEVMIALAIVAISLVSLLALGNRSIEVNGRLQHLTRATLLAQGKMTEAELAGSGGLDASEGAFEAPNDGYRWRVDYQDTPLATVEMVTVTVAWGDERKGEMVDLASFLQRGGGRP